MNTAPCIPTVPGSQLLVRWIGPPVENRITVDNREAVLRIWRECIAAADNFDGSKEHLVVVGLNSNAHFIGWHLVAMGSAAGVSFSARDVLRAGFLMDAERILIVHNHPSGVLLPSKDDYGFTKEIRYLGDVVGMKLAAHVIVNSEGTEGFEITDAHAAKPAVPAAENVVPFITSAGAGFRVEIPVPSAWMRRAGMEALQSELFNLSQSVSNAEQWVALWTTRGRSLKHHWKNHARLRKIRHWEFILSAPAMERIRAAARELGLAEMDLLVGIVGRACHRVEMARVSPEV